MSTLNPLKKFSITPSTPVNIYNSINYLSPYLQKQPLLQDLCFFIDYLNVDIEASYNDLRYKYIDWSKISEASCIQIMRSMGMDYIINIIEAITPSNSSQLLALCSVIWLLKGQLLGVDIIASIVGFTYKVKVWHEHIPEMEPNTAEIEIEFKDYVKLSQSFQYNFIEFLRQYLYPITKANVKIQTKALTLSYGTVINWERFGFEELDRYHGDPITYDCYNNGTGYKYHCYVASDGLRILNNIKWYRDGDTWKRTGYYSSNGFWGTYVYKDAYYIEFQHYEIGDSELQYHDTGELAIYEITPNVNYRTFAEGQTIDVYIRYSRSGVIWSNWTKIEESIILPLRYCQFKAVFNNTQKIQMVLYSFSVTLS